MTTVPVMGMAPSSARMAATAAWSAAWLSPRPSHRADSIAARSVTFRKPTARTLCFQVSCETATGSGLRAARHAGLVVVGERLDPLLRERVLEHLVEDLRRDRGDVGAHPGGLRHARGGADRRGDDLGVVERGLQRLDDLTQVLEPVLADVVEAAEERR